MAVTTALEMREANKNLLSWQKKEGAQFKILKKEFLLTYKDMHNTVPLRQVVPLSPVYTQ